MNSIEEYRQRHKELQRLRELVEQDPYRLRFHLMPPVGWLNDPNGLCQLKGVHHIYFQYTPFSASWGMKSWGHYTSKDWIHYKECEPFLFPDREEDRDGVYSGCAFVKDGKISYYYTGNVKYSDQPYDYILEGREQNTISFVSEDGFTHKEKTCLLKNSDYPEDMSKHVRDPKVFEENGVRYMVLGARSREDRGCVLIYRCENEVWSYHMRIESKEPFGYMWECPDLIKLDGQWFLMCCPQGVKQRGYDFANVYQCGYFPLQLDLEKKSYRLQEFHELDRGFDIYAAQSYEDEEGRRILIGWMGIPDAPYHNEKTVRYHWQHALTMPRALYRDGNRIKQVPLKEFEQLRKQRHSGSFQGEEQLCLSECCELKIEMEKDSELMLRLKEDLWIIYRHGVLTLKLGECGCGRDERSVAIAELKSLRLFLDTSSLEIFVNDGAESFTSRCYQMPGDKKAYIQGKGTYTWYELNGFLIER